ncbi:hypothetical protein ACVRZP_05535 [Streptococcus gallolyticus subsp. gallolyticus]|uniref:Uncharacterized protein n=1 Tax=Streptococcus gallolyticus (strain UCN34) TaxID=637909 RepID=A0AA36JYY6_STRG3|nr:hypothetical protein [Streptococcus gallolyticus]MCO7177434.1 hypothetical protein [Streptococcus gallolyticus]CBI14158.1 hypothetical protein GALLO_1667 [Streptococcus gallolyticus UCN34]
MITQEMITEYLFVLAGLLVITGLLAATEYLFDCLKWLVKKLVAAMEQKEQGDILYKKSRENSKK